MLILLSSTSPTPSTHQKLCSKCCGPPSRAFAFCAMPCFPPSGRIHRETAPLMSRHTEQIPALQWLSRAVGGTAYLSFPSCRCLFYFHKSFQRGHFLKSSLPQKIQPALCFYLCKKERRPATTITVLTCFQVHRIRGHVPASNASAMQEPFPSHLLQYLIPKYVWFDFPFFFFVGAWSKEAFKICP